MVTPFDLTKSFVAWYASVNVSLVGMQNAAYLSLTLIGGQTIFLERSIP